MAKGSEKQLDKTIVAVDVGNSETALGVFDGAGLVATWSLTTPARLTDDEAFAALSRSLEYMARKRAPETGADASGGPAGAALPVQDAILSSVVPHLTSPWQEALRLLCGRRPLTVGPGLKTGIRMRYRDPAEVGADRIADLAAILSEYPLPVVAVDLGTTTNFEVVDADGVFLGGIIAPGMALGARSLYREAAKLPIIEVRAPERTVGTSTREAMQSGIVLGEIARIDGLLDRIAAETGLDFRVVVTGSEAAAIAALLEHDAIPDKTLTLRGLARLYALNRC